MSITHPVSDAQASPRHHPVKVHEPNLIDLILVAIGNTTRTSAQQASLLAVCEQIDNAFTDWSALVHASWEFTPCEGNIGDDGESCGQRVRVGVRWCPQHRNAIVAGRTRNPWDRRAWYPEVAS